MNVFALILIAFGVSVCLLNWGTLLASWRTKRFVSAIPLVGALPLGVGLSLLPETRAYAWLALIADYGTLILILALPRFAYEFWSTLRIHLVHSFLTDSKDRVIAIKLFRSQIAVISARFIPPIPCNGQGAKVVSFRLVGEWAPIENGFSIKGYASGRQLHISKHGGNFVTVELNDLSDPKQNYDGLDGLVVVKCE